MCTHKDNEWFIFLQCTCTVYMYVTYMYTAPGQTRTKTECVLRRPPIRGWKTNFGFIRHPTRTGSLRFGGHLNPQFYFRPPIGGRLNMHSVFLRVLPVAASTRHSWLWQTWDDVYTRRCFSESEGTRFGAPGQKALPSMNEFTLLWILA